jgi:hypothetical protein
MNPKNIRAQIALPVNGAVIYVVRPVVDRATVERGKIIPRQHVARLENRVIKGDSTPIDPHKVIWVVSVYRFQFSPEECKPVATDSLVQRSNSVNRSIIKSNASSLPLWFYQILTHCRCLGFHACLSLPKYYVF